MLALIVVDVQNDFLPGGALAVRDGDQVIPVANAMMARADLVVASQDWHPPDHGSFAANHPGHEIGEVIELDGLPQILWPVHCVQGTGGAALADGLDTSRIDEIVHKGTDVRIDSYGAFHDNAKRRSTGLADLLRDRGVDTVEVLGLATDYCVKFTALDAVDEGFRTRLVLAGCRGVDLQAGDVERAVEEMRGRGVEVV